MKIKPLLLQVIGLTLCVGVTYGQGALGPTAKKARTLEDYTPSTLKEIAAEQAKRDGLLPFRVRVVMEASARPISATSRKVLRDWALCCAGNPDHYKGYVREIRLVENGTDYWLAIEDGLASDLQKESKAGDVVDLFLIRLSPPEMSGKRRSVLLVERFQKAETNSAQLEESLAWIRSNLASYAQRNLAVEVPAPCQLKITDLSNVASVSKAIVFVPLTDLDVSKVKVEPRSDTWALWLHAVAGKKAIRFMLYQGVAAEGGQADDYSLIFRDREKAEAMAEAFRRTINLCAKPSL